MNKSNLIADIKEKAALVTADKTHVNHLVELVGHLESDSADISDAAQRAMVKVFIRFLQTKEMAKDLEDSPAITEYRKWLANCYRQTKSALLKILSEAEKQSQVLALGHCMKLLATEGKYPIDITEKPTFPYFPVDFLKSVLEALLSTEHDMTSVISKYDEFIEFEDVKYNTLKCLSSLLRDKKEDETEVFVINSHALLALIQLPILGHKAKRRKVDKKKNKIVDPEDEDFPDGQLLCEPIDVEWPKFKLEYQKVVDFFSSAWLKLLSYKIPTPLYRKILLKMDEKILPHFRNPLTLTDFLVNSFNVGGSISLLALSSLFILIQKCNLEYPEFFTKLYSMFEPNILYVKYRPKFFFWADIFLTSSHVPAYVAAAFIKRTSRLALTAPVDALIILVPLIGNILIRHKSLVEALVNRTDTNALENDPFDNNEPDPVKCKAIDSCLWEVKTLQSHWHPRVSSAACFINRQLPLMEFDLSDVLETTFDELLEEALEAEMKSFENVNLDTPIADKISEKLFGLTARS